MAKDLELNAVLQAMISESDRGSVLLGASLIEWQLGRLLKAAFLYFNPPEKLSPRLNDQLDILLNPQSDKSLIGSASARMRVCRALGLIDDDFHKSLQELFIFRNHHFAHSIKEVKLSNSAVAKDLSKVLNLMPDFSEMYQSLGMVTGPTDDRRRFSAAITTCYYLLEPENALRDHANPSPRSTHQPTPSETGQDETR